MVKRFLRERREFGHILIYFSYDRGVPAGSHEVDKSKLCFQGKLYTLRSRELRECIVSRTARTALCSIHARPVKTLAYAEAPAVVATATPKVLAVHFDAGKHTVGLRGCTSGLQFGATSLERRISIGDSCRKRVHRACGAGRERGKGH